MVFELFLIEERRGELADPLLVSADQFDEGLMIVAELFLV